MRTSLAFRAALATVTGLVGLTGLAAVPAVPAYASGGQSYTWTGLGTSDSWTDQANWSPTGVPGQTAGDSASISSSSTCVDVTNVQPVTLASFSLSIGLHGCGATVTGGPITAGAFSWNGGTLNSAVTVTGSGTISGSNGHMNVLNGDVTVSGTLALSGLVEPSSTSQGGLRVIDPHTVHVLPGATLRSDGTNAIQSQACCVNPAAIVNDGTLQVGGGDLTAHGIGIRQNGTLATGTDGGLVDDGAPATAADGATYSGAGRWVVEDGAALTASGTQQLGSGFRLTLGDGNTKATLGGTSTLSGPGTLDWAGGTITGNLTIAPDTTLSASGTTSNNGKRVLDGTGSGSLTNHGTVSFSGGAGVMTAARSQLVNASDGTLDLAPGTVFSALSCCVNPNQVVNQGGQVVVPAGSSTDPVQLDGVSYLTTGGTTSIAAGRTLDLLSAPSALTGTSVSGGGTLDVSAPTAVSGTNTIGTGTTLALAAHGSLDGTSTIGGAGRTAWTGGWVSGKVTLATSGGVAASGSDPKGVANVDGGATPSSLTITAPLSIAAGTADHHDTLDVGQSTLTLTSTTTLAANTDLTDGTVRNTGRLTVDAGNGGVALRTGDGSFVTSNQVTVASGTWQLTGDYRQTAGRTTLATGTHLNRLYTSYPIAIAGGTLDGTGTIGAGVSNTGGTIRPGGTSTGTLTISGDYDQTTHGALALDLTARAHDQLAVAGTAAIAGSLHATNLGSYAPAVGHKVGVANGGSLSTGRTCVTTSGSRHTTGHWVATRSGRTLDLVWRKGAAPRC
jgi:hypothetical protein